MKTNEIHTFSDLVQFLESYSSWDEGFAYDPGGIFQLVAALIRNLKANSIDADLRDINGYLKPDEKQLLARLSECAQVPEDD